MIHKRHFSQSITALALGLGGVSAQAGILTPPPGPITPTMKSLVAIEPRQAINSLPFTIAECGSYYLADCLTAVANEHGITIDADDVTLDLNGFALIGVPGSLDGVHVNPGLVNVKVYNGVVRDWDGDGVDGFEADNSQLFDLRAYNNGGNGLLIGGGGLVKDCTAQDNGQHGIRPRYQSTVSDCTSRGNGRSGIFSGTGTTVTACTSLNNQENGIELLSGSTVSNCTSKSNVGSGIVVDIGSMVNACTAQNNEGDGIVANWSTIRHCHVQANDADGIEVEFRCYVHDNNCSNNGPGAAGGAGIRATGRWNRIDGNVLTSNATGMTVSNSDNTIMRNAASDNTGLQYSIAGGNDVGPIGTAAASASPWSNIAF